jgi:epoxyqueuosine reductase
MTPMAFTAKEELIARAVTLGFDSCRIAKAEAPRHAGEFRHWLQDGAAGEMQWMERGADKRCDPQQVLPGARSVVVVALNYWQGDGTANQEPRFIPPPRDRPNDGGLEAAAPWGSGSLDAAKGKVARYAWGDDYHDLMLRKLGQLSAFLSERGGTQKCYVDTGPVLERDHAAEAGIGWHGKSTMLIDAKLGTWFFLGEILTTLDLPADPPQAARCGSCTRCITACPTGAITEPHRLDARRCISYLTIELKGSIPLELRPLIGDRIYGCDDCLAACPWNRFAAVSREAAFAGRPAVGMRLREYLALDDAQFREMFRGSPIKRIKRRGFLRNVCVALGNVGGAGDLPALERAARDLEPLIAEHAIWAIAEIRRRGRAATGPTADREGLNPKDMVVASY